MAGRRWSQHRFSRLALRWSGSVVAAIATGEEAFDDAFDAGRALGQGLDVLAQVGQIAADLCKVSTNFCSERLHVGANFRAQTLVVRADFGSQGLAVGARVTPEREQ